MISIFFTFISLYSRIYYYIIYIFTKNDIKFHQLYHTINTHACVNCMRFTHTFHSKLWIIFYIVKYQYHYFIFIYILLFYSYTYYSFLFYLISSLIHYTRLSHTLLSLSESLLTYFALNSFCFVHISHT